MAREFPPPAGDFWTQYKHVNENKLGLPKRDLFPMLLGAVTDELNSPEFTTWVSRLTGIPNLMRTQPWTAAAYISRDPADT